MEPGTRLVYDSALASGYYNEVTASALSNPNKGTRPTESRYDVSETIQNAQVSYNVFPHRRVNGRNTQIAPEFSWCNSVSNLGIML